MSTWFVALFHTPSTIVALPRTTRVVVIESAPSFPLLRRDALEAERWNRFHPDATSPRIPYVAQVLPHEGGPIVVSRI